MKTSTKYGNLFYGISCILQAGWIIPAHAAEVDLFVKSITATETAAPGNAIQATDMICNQSTRPSGLSYAALYLSDDPVITTDDTRISTHSTRITTPNGCVSGKYWGQLPALKPGTYYLASIADYRDDIEESDETNNTSEALVLTVVDGLADLVAKSVQGPGEAMPGARISASINFCNEGIRKSGDFTNGLYLSANTTIGDEDDIFLDSGDSILYNGQCNHNNASITGYIPEDLVVGSEYNLVLTVDISDIVPEESETNNSVLGNRVTISAASVDLAIVDLHGPATATTGQSVNLSGSICNLGDGSLPFQFGTIYLSEDSTITTGDRAVGPNVRVVGSQYSGNSSSQCSYNLKGSATIPADMEAGNYYWGAIADTTQSVPESDEDNNSFTGNLVNITKSQ